MPLSKTNCCRLEVDHGSTRTFFSDARGPWRNRRNYCPGAVVRLTICVGQRSTHKQTNPSCWMPQIQSHHLFIQEVVDEGGGNRWFLWIYVSLMGTVSTLRPVAILFSVFTACSLRFLRSVFCIGLPFVRFGESGPCVGGEAGGPAGKQLGCRTVRFCLP